MMMEDKVLLSSVPNNVSGCGEDDVGSVIRVRSTAIGFMGQGPKWIANRSSQANVPHWFKPHDAQFHSQNGATATFM